MWIIYTVAIIILLLLIMLFVFPIKIDIKHEIVPTFNKLKKYKSETVKEKHYLKIKLLGFILVYKKDLNKNKKKNDDNKLYKNVSNDPLEMVINSVFNALDKAVTGEKINKALLNSKDIKNFINSIYVKKLKLDLGINLINTILNAYISTLINVAINMFIANNINRFNLENTRYKTYISGEVYNIKIDSIIHLQLANIIYIIIKIIFKLRKVEKKNVRSKTSNRKFNDDSYDFA
jgi:ABC-type glycerol-3-phosphate transport system permease component